MQSKLHIYLSKLIFFFLITVTIVGFYYLGWYKPTILGVLTIGYFSLILLFLLIVSYYKFSFQLFGSKLLVKIFFISLLIFFLENIKFGYFSLSDFFKFLKPIVIFFVFYSLSRIIGYGDYILKLILIVLTLSIFVSIMQHFNFEFFWSIRDYFPLIKDEMVNNQIENKIRPPGLAYYSVQLQYQLQTILVPLSIFLLNTKKFKFIIIFLLVYAITLNLKSFFVSILVYIFLVNQTYFLIKLKYLLIFFLTIIAMVSYFVFLDVYLIELNLLKKAWMESIDYRLSYLITGLYVILSNPFGIENIQEILNELMHSSNFFSEYLLFKEYLFKSAYHNIFINIGLNYGWLGVFILIYLYKILYSYFNKNDTRSIISLSGKAFLISNLTIVFTHNSGPLTVDPYFWIIIGTLVGLNSAKQKHFRIKKMNFYKK